MVQMLPWHCWGCTFGNQEELLDFNTQAIAAQFLEFQAPTKTKTANNNLWLHCILFPVGTEQHTFSQQHNYKLMAQNCLRLLSCRRTAIDSAQAYTINCSIIINYHQLRQIPIENIIRTSYSHGRQAIQLLVHCSGCMSH